MFNFVPLIHFNLSVYLTINSSSHHKTQFLQEDKYLKRDTSKFSSKDASNGTV